MKKVTIEFDIKTTREEADGDLEVLLDNEDLEKGEEELLREAARIVRVILATGDVKSIKVNFKDSKTVYLGKGE